MTRHCNDCSDVKVNLKNSQFSQKEIDFHSIDLKLFKIKDLEQNLLKDIEFLRNNVIK